MMRRSGLLWLVAVVLISSLLSSCAHRCARKGRKLEERPIRFAVIGDRTGGHEPGIYGQIAREIEMMKPDFVLSVGDMIEGYTSDTVAIKGEWEEYEGLLESLSMPIHLAPGNHDIWDSTSLWLYERYIGQPYYSFNLRRMHFVFLDNSRSSTVETFPGDQIDWLIADLERNRDARHTFAVFHIPYWIETVASGDADTLHSLFVRYGVDAVFTGHYHSYFSGRFDGIIYTGVGSSGGASSEGPTGMKYHFVWVTVDDDEISIAPVRMGAVLPWDEVTAADYRFIREAEEEAIGPQKVPVGEDLKVPETDLKVTITNLNSDVILKDTLRWEVPPGWSLTPESYPVEIGALKSQVVDVTVKSSGETYPTPTLSVQYPYAKDKKFRMEKSLRVSRSVYAYEIHKAPVMDGRLNEDLWKNPVTKFFAPDGSPMVTDPVYFYFAWDRNNLYLGAKCMDAEMDAIVATAAEHDGAIYTEDCVGYFLQPETVDGPVYQIYFNPLGTAFDQKITVEQGRAVDVEREWDGTYEVETLRSEDCWSIEVKIPLSELETEGEPGKTWAINFRRKQKRLNSTADWQVPITYDPEDYGILLMKQKIVGWEGYE